MIRKCINVNYLSSCQYFVKTYIRFKTPILRSDLCDYSDAYIDVAGRISVKELIILTEEIKISSSRMMLHLGHAHQNLITHSLTTQKILLLLLCLYIIC